MSLMEPQGQGSLLGGAPGELWPARDGGSHPGLDSGRGRSALLRPRILFWPSLPEPCSLEKVPCLLAWPLSPCVGPPGDLGGVWPRLQEGF